MVAMSYKPNQALAKLPGKNLMKAYVQALFLLLQDEDWKKEAWEMIDRWTSTAFNCYDEMVLIEEAPTSRVHNNFLGAWRTKAHELA